MKTKVLIVVSVLLIAASCGKSKQRTDEGEYKLSASDKEEIMTTFIETQDAWNTGNLEGFMKGYWKSEKLVFTGVGGPTYGYNATLLRYKQSYPDTETMGMLKFTVKDLYKIDSKTVIMIGKYYLSRSIGDMVGHYTLVWQRIDNNWLIISDHSSGQAVQK